MANECNNLHKSPFVYYILLKRSDDKFFEGTIYPQNNEDKIAFRTFDDFIVNMDTYMDIYGPQSFQDKRSLTKKRSMSHMPLLNGTSQNPYVHTLNEQDTYILCIYSRRNTEWQGCVYFREELQVEFSNIIDLTNYFANL